MRSTVELTFSGIQTLIVRVLGKTITVWIGGKLAGTGELACADSLREIMIGGVRWHQSRMFAGPYFSGPTSSKCIELINEAHRIICGQKW